MGGPDRSEKKEVSSSEGGGGGRRGSAATFAKKSGVFHRKGRLARFYKSGTVG